MARPTPKYASVLLLIPLASGILVASAAVQVRPGDPHGLECGAAYVPDWALAELVTFAENQVKACDTALANVTSDATLRNAGTLIGKAIAENWNTYHGATKLLPPPGGTSARRDEVLAGRNQVQNSRELLRLLERVTRHLLRLSGDATLTSGQKTLILEAITQPGIKACVSKERDHWLWVQSVAGAPEQVSVSDPTLAEILEGMRNDAAFRNLTSFSFPAGPIRGQVRFCGGD